MREKESERERVKQQVKMRVAEVALSETALSPERFTQSATERKKHTRIDTKRVLHSTHTGKNTLSQTHTQKKTFLQRYHNHNCGTREENEWPPKIGTKQKHFKGIAHPKMYIQS